MISYSEFKSLKREERKKKSLVLFQTQTFKQNTAFTCGIGIRQLTKATETRTSFSARKRPRTECGFGIAPAPRSLLACDQSKLLGRAAIFHNKLLVRYGIATRAVVTEVRRMFVWEVSLKLALHLRCQKHVLTPALHVR